MLNQFEFLLALNYSKSCTVDRIGSTVDGNRISSFFFTQLSSAGNERLTVELSRLSSRAAATASVTIQAEKKAPPLCRPTPPGGARAQPWRHLVDVKN